MQSLASIVQGFGVSVTDCAGAPFQGWYLFVFCGWARGADRYAPGEHQLPPRAAGAALVIIHGARGRKSPRNKGPNATHPVI
jgi:hypothetical protein